jgi:hypothetical protein
MFYEWQRETLPLREATACRPRCFFRTRETNPGREVDGNGEISIEELVVVLHREQKATQNVRFLRKIVTLLAVSMIVLIAATAGVTYGTYFFS